MSYMSSSINWRMYEEGLIEVVGGDTYKGYPLIMRDTPITGGILYEPSGPGIVVDPNQHSQVYERLYERVKEKASSRGVVSQHALMLHLGRVVEQQVKYSFSRADRVIGRNTAGWPKEQAVAAPAINLGEYVKAKGGICTHQALAIGYLAERFTEEGYLPFSGVSVDSNCARRIGERVGQGHSWTRLTHENGEVLIYDAANRFYGPLSLVQSAEWGTYWPYARPEDSLARQ